MSRKKKRCSKRKNTKVNSNSSIEQPAYLPNARSEDGHGHDGESLTNPAKLISTEANQRSHSAESLGDVFAQEGVGPLEEPIIVASRLAQANQVCDGDSFCKQFAPKSIQEATPTRRFCHPSFSSRSSLRWENQLSDSDEERERIEQYKQERRKRYWAAARLHVGSTVNIMGFCNSSKDRLPALSTNSDGSAMYLASLPC